ncbi:MAG TPA: hypothetical protein HPP87_11530 [Planctomycetes bacterium]|nr:hypothetical protein [Planctomycetota bacterium]
MTKGNLNKEINKVIRERLANGQNKAEIFNYLKTKFDNDVLSARLLTISPYPQDCQKCRKLNKVLIAILVVITIAKVLFAAEFIMLRIPKAIPLLIIVPLINIYLIYLVAKFNILGYWLTVLFGLLGFCKIADGLGDAPSTVNIIIAAVMTLLMVTAIILSVVLYRRLLPNSSFFPRPKKKEAGEYIF